MGKYFQIEVKPTTDVAALAAGNYNGNDVMADWIGFDIPKGPARLIGITARYTGKNGVDYTPTDFAIYWAKSINGNAPGTLGDDGAAVDTFGWFPNIIGHTYIDSTTDANGVELIMGNILSAARPGGGASSASTAAQYSQNSGLVLQGEPDSGSNVGYDKLYVCMIAGGVHNWGASTMAVSTETATTTSVIVVKTLDALLSGIGPGDVLRDEDNQLLGTVKSVDSATQITLEDNCASVSAVDKLVYNTCPITLILSFEK